MRTVTLGKTGITVNKNGFGALPIQRISEEEAVKLLRKAHDNGIDFYDTARAYTDSEEKLGAAFEGMRDKIYIASKTMAEDAQGFWKDLETTLRNLKTDYLDIYQFHNPESCPWPRRQSKAVFMTRSSFRSVTFLPIRSWRWWRDAKKQTWDSLP